MKSKKQISQNKWDKIGKSYHKKPFNQNHAERYGSFKIIERYLNNNNPKKVIEVGSGSGITTLLLIRKKYNFHAYFLDISEDGLTQVNINANELGIEDKITLIRGNALKMPFDDNCFDFVWSGGVNEHFKGEERQLIFNEMVRITKVGGITLVAVPNKYYLPLNINKYISMMKGTWAFGYEEPYTPRELQVRMKIAGLKMVMIEEADFFIGLHFLLSMIPFLNKIVNFDNLIYQKVWASFQYLDNHLKIKPGRGLIAIGKKERR